MLTKRPDATPSRLSENITEGAKYLLHLLAEPPAGILQMPGIYLKDEHFKPSPLRLAMVLSLLRGWTSLQSGLLLRKRAKLA